VVPGGLYSTRCRRVKSIAKLQDLGPKNSATSTERMNGEHKGPSLGRDQVKAAVGQANSSILIRKYLVCGPMRRTTPLH